MQQTGFRCDVDHTIPFNHADPTAGGLTIAENLKCLCRQQCRFNPTSH